jgi:hypothetical protein
MERCATCILVVGDVLEHCLVVGSVLGVVRLEVHLIAGLLPWSSEKSERRICSTLRKLITSVNLSAMGNPKSINLERFYCTRIGPCDHVEYTQIECTKRCQISSSSTSILFSVYILLVAL